MDFDLDIAELPTTDTPKAPDNILTVILESADEVKTTLSDDDLDGFTFDNIPDTPMDMNLKPNVTTDDDGKTPQQITQTTIIDTNPTNSHDVQITQSSQKYTNLDQVQLQSLKTVSFSFDDFILPNKLSDLISNYSMPVKMFDASNVCYSSYSVGHSAVMQIKPVPEEPDDTMQLALKDYEFYYHYCGINQQTDLIPQNLVTHMSDKEILDRELFFDIFVTYDDTLQTLPFRISPISFLPPGTTNNIFEITEPLYYYDLIQGDTITVDASILCLDLTCTREYFQFLISGASSVYLRTSGIRKLSFKKMAKAYGVCVDKNNNSKQLFGIADAQIENLDNPNPNQPPLTKTAATDGSLHISYNVNVPNIHDIHSTINNYADTILKEFTDYQLLENIWMFHIVRYSIFADFIRNLSSSYVPLLENPFYHYPAQDEMQTFGNLLSFVKKSLSLSSDGRFVMGTTSKTKFSSITTFSLTSGSKQPVPPQDPIPNNNSTTITDDPLNPTNGISDLPLTSNDIDKLLKELDLMLSKAKRNKTNLTDRGKRFGVNQLFESSSISDISSDVTDQQIPSSESQNHELELNKDEMKYTINDPRLFHSVAGFPVLYPSVIQTITPSELASISLGHSMLPTNLEGLPLDSYVPLLPFKSHKLSSPPQDDLFLQMFTLFMQCDIINDFPNYPTLNEFTTAANRFKKSFGSMYIVNREQERTFIQAVSKSLNTHSTDVQEYLNSTFSSLLNSNLKDEPYVCSFLIEDTTGIERNNANVDVTNLKSSLEAIYKLIPSKYVDPLSYIAKLNITLTPESLSIPKSHLSMLITLHAPDPDPFSYFMAMLKTNSNLISRFNPQLFATLIGLHALYSANAINKMIYFANLINIVYLDTFCRCSYPTFTKVSDAVDDPKVQVESDLIPITIISFLSSILLSDLFSS